jgi:hypothetical protein
MSLIPPHPRSRFFREDPTDLRSLAPPLEWTGCCQRLSLGSCDVRVEETLVVQRYAYRVVDVKIVASHASVTSMQLASSSSFTLVFFRACCIAAGLLKGAAAAA